MDFLFCGEARARAFSAPLQYIGALPQPPAAGRVRRVAALPASDVNSIAASPDGSALFVLDQCNHEIRRVEVATGEMTTLAGSGEAGDADGVGDAAEFTNPCGIAISHDGSALFVAD